MWRTGQRVLIQDRARKAFNKETGQAVLVRRRAGPGQHSGKVLAAERHCSHCPVRQLQQKALRRALQALLATERAAMPLGKERCRRGSGWGWVLGAPRARDLCPREKLLPLSVAASSDGAREALCVSPSASLAVSPSGTSSQSSSRSTRAVSQVTWPAGAGPWLSTPRCQALVAQDALSGTDSFATNISQLGHGCRQGRSQ